MFTILFIFVLYHTTATCQIAFQQTVHHHIRITADRRSEVCIIIHCQPVVTDIIRRIVGFLHGTDSQSLHQIFFRFTLYTIQQFIDPFGYIRFRPFRTHFVTETANECGKIS